MKPERVVTRQHVQPIKLQRAKEMRQAPTPEEDLLWQHLRRGQLAGLHFRRQQVIDGFIADFYCHRIGLAVEIDGPIHVSNADYDRARDRVLRRRGVTVLRVSTEDVRANLQHVLARIATVAIAPNVELNEQSDSPSL